VLPFRQNQAIEIAGKENDVPVALKRRYSAQETEIFTILFIACEQRIVTFDAI